MPRAECSSTKNSLSSSTSCVHTRYGWKGATLRRTPIVIRTRNDACGADIDGVVDDVAARRLPRNKSGDGVALRGGVGDAGAKGERSSMVPHPHCDRPCFGHRRRGWVRMQVGFRDLTIWSFLTASAHGAGLMVVPVLLRSNTVEAQGQMAGHHHMAPVASPLAGILATGVHTIAYLAVTGLFAWVVYRK